MEFGNEKYDFIEAGKPRYVKVNHNMTESGVAYAVPNKSATNQNDIFKEDKKYMSINPEEDQVRIHPEEDQDDNDYVNLDPIDNGLPAHERPFPKNGKHFT